MEGHHRATAGSCRPGDLLFHRTVHGDGVGAAAIAGGPANAALSQGLVAPAGRWAPDAARSRGDCDARADRDRGAGRWRYAGVACLDDDLGAVAQAQQPVGGPPAIAHIGQVGVAPPAQSVVCQCRHSRSPSPLY